MSGLYSSIRIRRRRDRSQERPQRNRGVLYHCARCGDIDRMPTDQFWSMCALPLCRTCVMDDRAEATRDRPRPPMVAHDYDYAKWAPDPVPAAPVTFIITGPAVEDIFDG